MLLKLIRYATKLDKFFAYSLGCLTVSLTISQINEIIGIKVNKFLTSQCSDVLRLQLSALHLISYQLTLL